MRSKIWNRTGWTPSIRKHSSHYENSVQSLGIFLWKVLGKKIEIAAAAAAPPTPNCALWDVRTRSQVPIEKSMGTKDSSVAVNKMRLDWEGKASRKSQFEGCGCDLSHYPRETETSWLLQSNHLAFLILVEFKSWIGFLRTFGSNILPAWKSFQVIPIISLAIVKNNISDLSVNLTTEIPCPHGSWSSLANTGEMVSSAVMLMTTFHECCTLIFLYWTLVPLIDFGLLRVRQQVRLHASFSWVPLLPPVQMKDLVLREIKSPAPENLAH